MEKNQNKRIDKHLSSTQIGRHWIGGEWIESTSWKEAIDPATGISIGRFTDGGRQEAQAAIRSARKAFDTTDWPRNRMLRAHVLNEIADRITASREELINMLSLENGKILAESAIEVDLSAQKLRYFAGIALSDAGRAAEVWKGQLSLTVREPVGVAGIIVPWNSPIILLIRSLAPALAAGCTVVIKSAAQTALTSALLFEILSETQSLPHGVVNCFIESGNTGAETLVSSPDVDAISYTGSTRVGRLIMAEAARTMKRLSLELGGKTPMIIFDDANLDIAIFTAVRAILVFAGQFCQAGSRLLVHRSRLDEVRKRVAEGLEQVAVGPASDIKSEMGPMIDKANVARVDRIVQDAKRYGHIIVRGGPITEGPLAAGAFFRPTLIEVDDPNVPIVQEEIFGPVMTLEAFDDEVHAVRLANATPYGLSASIWTRNIDRALRVFPRIKAGTVWINTYAVIHDQFEEGGFKQSGIGRLNGPGGLDAFLETKHVAISG